MPVPLFSSGCLLVLLLPAVWAQDQPIPEEPPPPASTAPQVTGKDTGKVQKRLFGIFPNYQAANSSQTYVHPSVSDKFKIARQNSFDWPNIFLNVGYALQTQVAQNGFHQPAFGRNFAKYYGRAWSDSIIGNYTTQAILPSLLGEDPRYIRMGTGSGWARTWHAVSQVAITRGTNGRNRVHLSQLAGNAGVVALTSLYYPEANNSFGQSATRWGLDLGNDAIANLLTEFLPDIRRKLRRKH